MLKRIFAAAMAAMLLLSLMSVISFAAQVEGAEFTYELSVDGQTTREVSPGDVITVTLRLRNNGTADTYLMYAMQDEIRYDASFFELVEGSLVLNTGIESTQISLSDCYRELYMNYLSMFNGTQWEANAFVGYFQLRVIATSGVTSITNHDYRVSLANGSGSYRCDANELTIILSADCTVRFMSNGGTEQADQLVQYGERLQRPADPQRNGYVFAGWYKDITLLDEWDFDTDVVQGNMTLYAKWQTAPSQPEPGETTCAGLWWLFLLLVVLIVWYISRRKRKNADTET